MRNTIITIALDAELSPLIDILSVNSHSLPSQASRYSEDDSDLEEGDEISQDGAAIDPNPEELAYEIIYYTPQEVSRTKLEARKMQPIAQRPSELRVISVEYGAAKT